MLRPNHFGTSVKAVMPGTRRLTDHLLLCQIIVKAYRKDTLTHIALHDESVCVALKKMIRARDVCIDLQRIFDLARVRHVVRKAWKMKVLTPSNVRPPFARYAHGVEIPGGWRILRTSGQLGIRSDESIPAGAYEQAVICFDNIAEILRAGGMGPGDVAHITGYVTDRDHMSEYMKARDEFLANTEGLPASTLLIVSGFTRPEFMVEVEVMAAAP